MEFTGLLRNYRTNRPVDQEELIDRLRQGDKLDVQPHYQLSVIKMNSTYLECVDKWFAWKGLLTFIVIVMACASVGGAAAVGVSIVLDPLRHDALGFGIGQIAFSCVAALPFLWFLRKDSFAYTHYPIRFNRKTRMVHVFRTDGTVLSVPWLDIFFTLGHMAPVPRAEVRGHVLDTDKCTVRETFALSYVDFFHAGDRYNPWPEKLWAEDFIRAHWEFIRRYMADGPKSVTAQVQFCMPVDGRRERFMMGARRLFTNFAGAGPFMMLVLGPMCAGVSLARAFAMRTSKIPQWPKEVEASCAVEHDDPYAIAGAPDGKRMAVFPEAASRKGIRFVAPPCPAPGSANRAGVRLADGYDTKS